jgi:hypothetical protein
LFQGIFFLGTAALCLGRALSHELILLHIYSI